MSLFVYALVSLGLAQPLANPALVEWVGDVVQGTTNGILLVVPDGCAGATSQVIINMGHTFLERGGQVVAHATAGWTVQKLAWDQYMYTAKKDAGMSPLNYMLTSTTPMDATGSLVFQVEATCLNRTTVVFAPAALPIHTIKQLENEKQAGDNKLASYVQDWAKRTGKRHWDSAKQFADQHWTSARDTVGKHWDRTKDLAADGWHMLVDRINNSTEKLVNAAGKALVEKYLVPPHPKGDE